MNMHHLDWDDSLVQAFEPSVLANPWGFGTAMEVLSGCHAFEYEQGQQRALFAVRPIAREHGNRIDVTALVSIGDRLSAENFDAAMIAIAHKFNARALGFATMYPHIVQAAKRTGWTESGALMTKRLDQAL